MSSVCPSYNKPSFTDAQKRHLWVWIVASMAQGESSCIPTIDSKDRYITRGKGKHKHKFRFNPNGVASGLLQIEKNPRLRARRDRLYGGNFCEGNPHDPKVNIRCGIRMLKTVMDNDEGPYGPDNYWSVLIDPGTNTKDLISGYKACGTSSSRER